MCRRSPPSPLAPAGLLALLLTPACVCQAAVPALRALRHEVAFRSSGPGGGFSNPCGVAALADGGLVVVDRGYHHARVLDPKGQLVAMIGTGFGSDPGKFLSPSAAAVSRDGDIVIADMFNDRMQRFSRDGTLLQVFGNEAGSPGRLQHPTGVSCSPSGDWFVVDQWNHRVVRFTAGGQFVLAWGVLGTGPGEFQYPCQVAVDRVGRVYVTDLLNHRVQVFTGGGVWLRSWGSEGTGDGQFESPTGIAVDPQGSVFVAESGNDRLQRFTGSGVWEATFSGPGTDPGLLRDPMQIASSGTGRLLVADEANHEIDAFTALPARGSDEPVAILTDTWSLDSVDPTYRPNGIAADASGGVFVVDAWRRFRHLSPFGAIDGWVSPPGNYMGLDRYLRPSIAHHEGRIYLADPDLDRILVHDSLGNLVTAFGFPGDKPGYLSDPNYVRFDDSGVLHVLNGNPPRIDRFTPEGIFLSTLAVSANEGSMDVSAPGHITTFSQPIVLAQPIRNGILFEYTNDGTRITLVPALGTTELASVVDLPGRGLYVSERHENAIRRYDEEGTLRGRLVLPPLANAGTSDLVDMDTSPGGDLFVNDRFAQVVRRYATPAEPVDLVDRPADQGFVFRLRFLRSSTDHVSAPVRATGYQVLRRMDGDPPPAPDVAPGLPDWEIVATVPATTADEYSVDVPSLANASPGAVMLSTYSIRTLTSPALTLDSRALTGASTDDVEPEAPGSLQGGVEVGGLALHWRAVSEPVSTYRVYRGAEPDFEISEMVLIGETIDTAFVDPGAREGDYAVTAVDLAGNEGPPARIGPGDLVGGSGEPPPPLFSLSGAWPNPTRGEPLVVTFSLPDASSARLQLFDPSGRLVVSQELAEPGPGTHRHQIRPSRRLAPGLYLIRLTAGAGTRVARAVVLD